ncbi:putative membrane protein [Handroanthus impetiginosus]|uniref:Putative membrane protein n=1 Tax=Handroanthus impetiginosus TaxID=429701 RepID=A0A2G9GE08_9LAMI|nr:putative membrane protein [Handroanthus impetiginosus]
MESFNPNKHLKEQFVSNLTGSSKLEIVFLITNLSILILVRHCIGFNWISSGSVKKDDNTSGSGKNLKAYIVALTVDFLCIVVPYILFITVLAEWTYGNTILVVSLLLFLRTFDRNRPSLLQEGDMEFLRASISFYRVSMMLLTCFSILAVDFKIFPRRYAKTETFGTSLMDLGVGSFVVANSLVSRQARGISQVTLGNALRSTSPLIILGFARLISTSSVNYQVHVGEYGVHWNFFFTLAAVAVLTSVINVHPNYCGILGSFILIGYQAILLAGLNKYLISGERGTDIFSQNKEGIISIFGEDLSCNLAYVSLVLASNIQVIAILMFSDYASGCKSSALEGAFNRNLLATFLLANILTGLVNLSIDTLSVSPTAALSILFAYAFVLSFAVGFADFLGIKLKFW